MYIYSNLIILPILFNFISAQKIPNCPPKGYTCDTDWQIFKDPNSGDDYGYKAFIEDKINFYEADVFCRSRCSEVVSIHSQDEQDFVTRIAGGLLNRCQFTSVCSERMEHVNNTAANFDRMLRGFWIGMNRVWGTLLNHNTTDTTVRCIWSDRSECDFGAFPNGSVTIATVSPPWTRGNPNGANRGDPLIVEACVQMVEGRRGGWNDIPCSYRLGGVICKRRCNSYCAAQDV
ncbi:hypothetical protein ACQ4LE_003446 [Meloidogyne hapla]|uniref:C-type lectin domain-containing protein n=1 Tax=Meloidogyne hapla TaxID=6305 RepID=A0A1I8BNV5_MELHA